MLRRFIFVSLLITVLGLLSPNVVKADDIFTLQLGGSTYTWDLPASPSIPAGDATAVSFMIPDVTYSVNGVATTFFPNQFEFFTTSDGGGFALLNTLDPSFPLHVSIDEFGPQLFDWGTSTPTFLPGTYTLTGGEEGSGTLVITDSSTSVPEPGSLLLIGSGALAWLGFIRNKIGKHSPLRF